VKTKELWLFLAKLLSLTLVLSYLWLAYWQLHYPKAIQWIALPFFDLVGVKKWYMALLLDHFTNLVPFVALVLATPGVFRNWRKTLAVMAGGLAAIICCQLLLSWAVYELISRYAMTKMYYKLSQPLFLINDTAPLILWVAFYPEMLGRLFGLRLFANREEQKKTGRARRKKVRAEPG